MGGSCSTIVSWMGEQPHGGDQAEFRYAHNRVPVSDGPIAAPRTLTDPRGPERALRSPNALPSHAHRRSSWRAYAVKEA